MRPVTGTLDIRSNSYAYNQIRKLCVSGGSIKELVSDECVAEIKRLYAGQQSRDKESKEQAQKGAKKSKRKNE